MKRIQSFLLCAALMSIHALKAPYQVFTSPGFYNFGFSLQYTPASDNDQILVIDTSDIILDFVQPQNTLSEDFTAGFSGLIGIYVTPNNSNVIIRNGTLDSIDNIGIYVSQGCSNININNMQFEACGNSALSLIGTDTLTNNVDEIIIENCTFLTSATTADAQAVILLQNCANTLLSNNIANQNGSALSTIDVFSLNNCTKNQILTCQANNSTAAGVNGFHITSCSETLVQNCNAFDNEATTTTVTGFLVDSESSGLVFDNCIAQGNIADAADCRGFSIEDSTACDYQQCEARLNVSSSPTNSAIGFNSNDSSLVNLIGCLASGSSSPGSAYGILWNGNNQSALRNCIAQSNSGSTNSIGCQLNNCTQYSLIGNQFLYNSGTNSFNRGLYIVNGSTRLALNNISFNNGASNTEQIDGLASSETTDYQTSLGNLNSTVTNYWTNIRAF